MRRLFWFAITLLVSMPLATPQQSVPKNKAPRQTANRQGDTMGFLWAELSFPGLVVKGEPFSAEALTEWSQTLSDGNRIARRMTARIYRDREGRTRHDVQLGSLGPWSTGMSQPMESCLLQDHVAGVGYTLNARTHTAYRYPLRKGATSAASAGKMTPPQAAAKRAYGIGWENLGLRLIEGVETNGVRNRTTIPAGQVGNERPIETSYERWTSLDLQIVVMSRYVDPRYGESVYRLTNLRRDEPAPSLFLVPADYVVTGKLNAQGQRNPK